MARPQTASFSPKDHLRVFLTAVMFLTRLPCPRWVGHHADDLARSTVYFPVVGVLVGGIAALVFGLVQLAWPVFLAVVAALAASAWATGAFHEDGLADVFDGFGGGWARAQVLAIMKDSRIGTYGVIALVLVVAGKLGALSSLPALGVVQALFAGHVLGRWSSLPLIYRYAYVREASATGKPFAASVTRGRLVVGSALALLIVGATLRWQALPALATALGVTAVAGWYFYRRIGGITGDCLGATNQLVELSVYLALAFDLS